MISCYTLKCDWCGYTWDQPQMTAPHMCGACRSEDSHEVDDDLKAATLDNDGVDYLPV